MELSEIKLNDKECNGLASSEHWRVLNSFLWLPVRVVTWVGGRAYWKKASEFLVSHGGKSSYVLQVSEEASVIWLDWSRGQEWAQRLGDIWVRGDGWRCLD